jgi:hypothetical protein
MTPQLMCHMPHSALMTTPAVTLEQQLLLLNLLVNFGETGLIGLSLSFDDTGALQAEEALFAALIWSTHLHLIQIHPHFS